MNFIYDYRIFDCNTAVIKKYTIFNCTFIFGYLMDWISILLDNREKEKNKDSEFDKKKNGNIDISCMNIRQRLHLIFIFSIQKKKKMLRYSSKNPIFAKSFLLHNSFFAIAIFQ